MSNLVGSITIIGPQEIGSPEYKVIFDPAVDLNELSKFYDLVEDIECKTFGVYSVMDYFGLFPDGDRSQPESMNFDAAEATEESWPVIRALFEQFFKESGLRIREDM